MTTATDTSAARTTHHASRDLAELARAKLACLHRDDKPYRAESCVSCQQRTNVPLFKCAVHGRCTLVVLVKEVECCRICGDRKAPTNDPVLSSQGV